jgi:hypothetical protein
VALVAIAIGAAVAPAPAAAGVLGEGELFSFGEFGSGAGQFDLSVKERAGGIATDPTSGHVFIADANNSRIDEFTAWGEFVKSWGWGVDDGSPEAQTCTEASGCQKGLAGGGMGQLNQPSGIAVAPGGDVYVFEARNHRLQAFDPDGDFVRAIGGDVIAHGPGDSASDETQEVTVAASSGTFKLTFKDPFGAGEAKQTPALPFNASAAEVQAALNGLATIGGLGGSVSVTGGPGNATGSAPYEVTFEGNLAGDDVPQLTIDRSALGPATIGARLVCSTATEAESLSFQWLRNGTPIPGATSPTYVTQAADEGKAIQCLASAFYGEAGMAGTTIPAYVAPPAPGTALPVAPSFMDRPRGGGVVGSSDQPFECNTSADSWQNATSFSYSWYRNGIQIPGATSSTYVATEADLAEPATFQCGVTGANAGGAVTKISDTELTNPDPTDREWWIAVQLTVSMEPVRTLEQGGGPEVCSAAAGDVCKTGHRGTAAGEFEYEVIVQWMTGDNLEIGDDGTIYVGDWGLVQEFKADGTFKGSIALPRSLSFPALPMPMALSLNRANGDIYVGFFNPLHAAAGYGPAPAYRLSPTGNVLSALPMTVATTALGVDLAGTLYAVEDPDPSFSEIPSQTPRLLEIDGTGGVLDECCIATNPNNNNDTHELSAVATNTVTAAGGTGLYVAHFNHFKELAFIQVLGTPPDKWPPPLVPPAIKAQFAKSVGEESASLAAEINPNFWKDTSYHLEYGTAPCAEGGCKATAERQLGAGIVKKGVDTAGTVISGLSPGTTYHYRFVAKSSGGGPVTGPDTTFTTFAAPAPPESGCPNQELRSGPAAALADCRAYEMVSPVDKGGGDILTMFNINGTPARLRQASSDGEAITYSASNAFGDSQSSPYTSQYLARRGAGGWATQGISPPQENGVINGTKLDSSYRAFSDDLSSGWLVQQAEPPLAPGAAPGLPNLYRRDSASGGYEALSTEAPSNNDPANYVIEMQGFSADGTRAFFRANGKLTADANGASSGNAAIYQTYEAFKGKLRLVSVRPSGIASPVSSTVGSVGGLNNNREANVATAVSEDGSRVYWGESADPKKLYVRVDATTTVAVSSAAASFWAAKPDGSQAIYTEAGALKLFDLASKKSSTLAGEGVIGVLGQSRDLSRVYFGSTAALAEGAQAGKPNLYLYEAGQPLAYLATLSGADVVPSESEPSPFDPSPQYHLGHVSADGGVAVFMSRAALTGADNTDQQSHEADAEVFRYEAASGELRCVSCIPSGARPRGRQIEFQVGEKRLYWYASRLPTWEFGLHAPRVIAAEGDRVFFDSLSQLVLADRNEAKDAYEWEAPGTGTCTEEDPAYVAQSGGCISLISSGAGPSDAEFLDASADGRDVFFLTDQSLVEWDPAQIDVYDARVEGGFPPPPGLPAACEGEACQSPATLPPEPPIASLAYQGPGNPKAESTKPNKPRCPRSKRLVRKAGKSRCVPRNGAGKKQRRHNGKKEGGR